MDINFPKKVKFYSPNLTDFFFGGGRRRGEVAYITPGLELHPCKISAQSRE